ncbi:tyrosine-type recombinase/integrase [Rhodopseudomonas pseudopalustris]|uniref:Phage integrase family protein n=1 Tax=Rhodopseudomonas pseudopalustris TaxID=1513892 RepID=A0A1H8LTD8_9BRAD|nr:tyrosine-type recombinase/integrase [Rhodopseudomonas pseudopalustris]SEO08128.1 Phage integrase family protein [Rhodopseudomonas pseudopalustris]
MVERNEAAAPGSASKLRSIDTAAKRSKLYPRKNPYWHGVGGGRGGVSLGYRKGPRGGVWVVKVVIDGERAEERLGPADDDGAVDGALSYPAAVAAALDWSKRQAAVAEATKGTEDGKSVPTVRAVVETYSERRHRVATGGKCSASHLLLHLPADCPLGRVKLSHLTSKLIDDWLDQLKRTYTKGGQPPDVEPKLSTGSLNRLLNDLRAALNAATDKYRRQLPGHIAAEVKAGTRTRAKEPDDLDEGRMQLLTDLQVCDLVEAAFKTDDDFGHLVLIAASTGARYSQIVRLTVADVQIHRARIMMPGARKGRKRRARAPAAVPVSADVVERLGPILIGRSGHEPLLRRWVMKRVGGAEGWTRDRRRPWGPAFEVRNMWEKTITAAGVLDDTIMYAFRHSSIVRGLIAGLPVRLVAALHDTSIRMIEEHYSAYIVDMTEDLARRHAISIVGRPTLQAAE